MPDESLQVIHIPDKAADPLLSFDSEWELSTRSTGTTDVVVVTPRPTTSRNAHVSESRQKSAPSVAEPLTRLNIIAAFVSGVIAGSVLSLLLTTDSSVNSLAEVPSPATMAAATAPVPAPPPVTEPRSVGTTGSRAAKPVTAVVSRGSLRVTSQPTGASVFINNSFVGRTPLVIRTMAIGSRAVRVTLDGYATWSRGVRIVANQSTTVVAELHPAKTPPSSTK